jgi:hypothetical protein
VSIGAAAEPTGSNSSRFKGARPLVWTVGIGLVGLLFSVVAAVYADAIFPAQPPVPLLDPATVAAVPVPTSSQETIQHVGSTGSVDPTWVDRVAKATGIPARALSAYAEADLDTADRQPGCHLRWNMLAGLGLIESNHGRHGGAVLQADGTPSIPIVGPALDGSHGTKALPATPAGARWSRGFPVGARDRADAVTAGDVARVGSNSSCAYAGPQQHRRCRPDRGGLPVREGARPDHCRRMAKRRRVLQRTRRVRQQCHRRCEQIRPGQFGVNRH